MEFYDFKIKNLEGELIDFNKYRDKVVLIVNVASKCGYTKQYAALEALHQKYFKDGLCILGFPCKQFANEEYSDHQKIREFCSTKYQVTFELFELTKVKGKEITPLYKFLISHYDDVNVKWNFEKFLINRTGKVIARILSKTKPEDIENEIVAEINKK
ncbi:MAG: glutathione peroxidase [Mycoplasmoidaceae bacterium]